MNDRALRMRFDVDVRGDDEVGLGAARTGPPGPPVRDGEVAVVLGTALARTALARVPADRRASVARDLADLQAGAAAADLASHRVPGAAVRELRAEEQVGARGWCARAVVGDGASPSEALLAVDAIRLPDDSRTDAWAARVPWMVPALVRHVTGPAPDALARSVLALRALGAAVAADPSCALDEHTASLAAAEALAAPRPVPGAEAFAPAPAPADAITAVVPDAPTVVAPVGIVPTAMAADRRLLAVVAASIGLAALALVLVFAIIASPGWFGLASSSEVNDRVSVVEAGVGQLRNDVGTLARDIRSGGAAPDAVQKLARDLESLRREVDGLCSVLPVVC